MLKKRGNIAWDSVVHIIIILLIFSSVFWFVSKQSNGSFFYEEIYAKEIGLIIDSSRLGMKTSIDFSKGFEIAEKNKKEGDLVSISEGVVKVSLTDKGSYIFRTFRDYEVNFIEDKEENKLIVLVGGKND